MAELPNKDFITYLGNYGQGGSSQFDEFVAQAARKYHIEPFEIVLPRQEHYRAAIKSVIDSYQSTVVLLSGRAGDGKTHFLRKLFMDPDFIGHSLAEWERSPNCFSVTTDTAHGPITFTLVKDFTSNDTPKVTAQLRESIIAIMEQVAAQNQAAAPAPDSCHIVIIAGNSGKIMERFQSFFANSSPNSPAAVTRDKDKDKSSKAAIATTTASIALAPAKATAPVTAHASAKAKATAPVTVSASSTAPAATQGEPPQRLQQFIQALELYMLEANASKLKNFLGVQCHDMSACLGAAEIQAIFTAIMQSPYWDKCTTCSHYGYCPIVRNRQLLMQPLVMQRLLQLHELMIDNGLHFTVRNVFLLFTKALLGRNTKTGDLSCTTVSSNVSRHKTQFQSTDQQALDRALMQFNLASLPFDNFFGLNASSYNLTHSSSRKNAANDEQLTPIFRDLQTIGVGRESTKLVDELLCTGHSTAAAPLLQRAYQELLVPHDHYALTAELQRAYTHLQANLGDDDDKENASAAAGNADNESDTLKQMRDLMASLRRVLFFTMRAPALEVSYGDDTSFADAANAEAVDAEAAANTPPFFNPYLLTAYPHALQYLALKHEVQASANERLQFEQEQAQAEAEAQDHQEGATAQAQKQVQKQEQEQEQNATTPPILAPHDYCPVEISTYTNIAHILIIGLNRAFTNMMLLKNSAQEVFITTSNQLNPSAQSIIYDTDHYRISVDLKGHKQDTCLRFECSPSNLITLVFHQSANDFFFAKGAKGAKRIAANAQAGTNTKFSDKNSRLVLTPQLFEYLMSLASGQVGRSGFTSCHHNLMAFKASIDAMLSQTLNYNKKPSDLLNNVFVCQLDNDGGFAL